jgi:hypothetical protein
MVASWWLGLILTRKYVVVMYRQRSHGGALVAEALAESKKRQVILAH